MEPMARKLCDVVETGDQSVLTRMAPSHTNELKISKKS